MNNEDINMILFGTDFNQYSVLEKPIPPKKGPSRDEPLLA
jgi:hypothetical protein